MGRPTKYNDEISDSICEWLAGGKSLHSFAAVHPEAPDESTIYRWVVRDEGGFRNKYMQAREAAGFAHADSIIRVVEGVADRKIDDRSARAMMDGLKWAAERMAPRAHGTRQEIDHQSSDGTMSPPSRIELVAPDANGSD